MGFQIFGQQTALNRSISFSGIGVHSNKKVNMVLHPAEADSGVVFSVHHGDSRSTKEIDGNIGSVSATDLCTVLGDPKGVFVATIEHLMAAIVGMGLDNVRVEVDSVEVPVLDGSARQFADGIRTVGLATLAPPKCFLRVKKPVRVDMGQSWAEFLPHHGMRYEVEIDFSSPTIGRQKFAADMSPDVFYNEISRARTFGFMADVERLWEAGFAQGSSLENSVVIDKDDRILNSEGLRYKDEFVRHKTLDAMGDLALAGAAFIGKFRSYRGGHKLNSMILKALLSDASAFEFVSAPSHVGQVHYGDLVNVGVPAYAANLI